LLREKITGVDAIFLTHWHYDHFGGLGELEYYVKLWRKELLPLYLPPSAIGQREKAFPNLAEVFAIRAWEFGKAYTFGAISITPLPANHGIETAGFLVKSDLKRLAYFPDTAGLPDETAQQVKEVDWFICDATFYGGNWFPASHMNVEEAIALGRKIQADHTILTHLSVHYSQPVTVKELNEITSSYRGVQAAYDGMLIDL
jgi:phosphoribosyl 1,2-cyclic phosphate phosphodiesterase